LKRTEFDYTAGKVVGMKESEFGADEELLRFTLFKTNSKDSFPMEELQKMPSTVLQKLAEMSRKLNGMDDQGKKEAAKNSQEIEP
jgi:hypothetical protein